MGVVAGGMSDGTISLWDPAQILAGAHDAAAIAEVKKHRGTLRALQFNPHRSASQLLASGGSDAKVCITDLTRPTAPTVFTAAPPEAGRHDAEVLR